MKASEVYLKAAELIASGEEKFACCAIAITVLGDSYADTPEEYELAKWFRPSDAKGTAWANTIFEDGKDFYNDEEVKGFRETMLLFMSCIARDSERGEGEAK